MQVKREINTVLIIFLPMLLVFDVLQYWMNRSSCLTCGNVPEFIRNSSLTSAVIAHTFVSIRGAWRKK
ncbi:MAG: hypothetical protein WCO06_00750 [Candidatus Roizmanbacteria bacterium]